MRAGKKTGSLFVGVLATRRSTILESAAKMKL